MPNNTIHIVVGLGNPEYWRRYTRHNIGFDVVENFARYYLCPPSQCLFTEFKYDEEINACVSRAFSLDGDTILCLPLEGMNSSGEPVSKLVDKVKEQFPTHKIKVLVVYDDMDLKLGVVRYKKKMSRINHNGVKSLAEHLEPSISLSHLKFGIGRPPEGTSVLDWVLGVLPRMEREKLFRFNNAYINVSSMHAAACLIKVFLADGSYDDVSRCINKFN